MRRILIGATALFVSVIALSFAGGGYSPASAYTGTNETLAIADAAALVIETVARTNADAILTANHAALSNSVNSVVGVKTQVVMTGTLTTATNVYNSVGALISP